MQDPYERKMVAVIRSRVQGGGEGLVARRHLTQGTVIGRGHPAAVRMGQGPGVTNLRGQGSSSSTYIDRGSGVTNLRGQGSFSSRVNGLSIMGRGHPAARSGVIQL